MHAKHTAVFSSGGGHPTFLRLREYGSHINRTMFSRYVRLPSVCYIHCIAPHSLSELLSTPKHRLSHNCVAIVPNGYLCGWVIYHRQFYREYKYGFFTCMYVCTCTFASIINEKGKPKRSCISLFDSEGTLAIVKVRDMTIDSVWPWSMCLCMYTSKTTLGNIHPSSRSF